LLTYIGNKRSLLGFIAQAVERVQCRLGKEKLRVFDVFAGSGVVSRFLKAHASLLMSNDFEDYAAVVGRCYLRNRSTVEVQRLAQWINDLNVRVEKEEFTPGFIEELYAPKNEDEITADDRVFYTRENARRLDNYRRLIETAPAELQEMLLGPLLSEASIHANTAGVFKGFYKDRRTGVGRFGGSNGDALLRIRGPIQLAMPVLSRFECDVEVMQSDANAAARQVHNLDLTYIDPPYNQHPYGSNYFMLNLLVRYQRPSEISRIQHKSPLLRVASRLAPLARFAIPLDLVQRRRFYQAGSDDGVVTSNRLRAMLGDAVQHLSRQPKSTQSRHPRDGTFIPS
jgi:adenine-specific DNA-methyltransferase